MRLRLEPERGAALVVSLILAGLIATLAALSVQSSTLELQSAAAARYRLQALAAAESCAAQLTNALIALPPPTLPADIGDMPVPGQPADRMHCSSQAIGVDAGIALRSAGALVGTHYVILAGGSSARAARSAIEQGVLLVRNGAGTLQSATRSYWVRLD
jgi:hypothetical protein